MDFCDRAQQSEGYHRRLSLDRIKGAVGGPAAVSQLNCTGCGDEIPEVRRKAVPGCTRCVSCQQELEAIPR